MKKSIRLISLFLSIIMIFSTVSSAFADNADGDSVPLISETDPPSEKEPERSIKAETSVEELAQASSETKESSEVPSEHKTSSNDDSVKEKAADSERQSVSPEPEADESVPEQKSIVPEEDAASDSEVNETTDTPENDDNAEETVVSSDAEEDQQKEEFVPCKKTNGCTLPEGHEGECVVADSEHSEHESDFVPCTKTAGCTLSEGHEGECVVADSEHSEHESDFVPCTKTAGCTLPEGHEGECVIADSEHSEHESDFVPCTKLEGCTLADGHEGDCLVVEPTFVPCTKTEGCTLADGHEGECVLAEDIFIPCTRTEGCILEDGHEGDCVLAESVFIPCTRTEGCILEDGHEGDCVLAEDDSLPYGFPGMPEGFTLSKTQTAQKKDLAEHDVAGQLADLVEEQHYVKGEVLLITKSKDFATTVAEAYNAKLISFNGHFAVLRLREASVLEAVTIAQDLTNNMPAVSPNYIRTLEPIRDSALTGSERIAVPQKDTWKDYKDGDPLLADPSSSDYQWHHDMVNSYEAWSTTKGSRSIKVAVLDSGVDSTHPDLANVKCIQVGTLPATPSGQHGTHIAGIIAASLGNGEGGAGIAPGVSIYSYRIIDDNGRISSDNECEAILAAIDDDVDIMNLSIGGIYYDAVENSIIQSAVSSGITLVAAMGNDGSNCMLYPAGYDNVIAVGAVTQSGARAHFSNYGSWCDISAPGISILSTIPGGGYDIMRGTSQAVPIVVGALALYMSKVGHVSPSAALKKLKSCVTKCSSSGMGAGIIDVSKLFSADKTKPVFTLSLNGYEISNLKSGVPYDSVVKISLAAGATNDGMIIYTTDGKNPAISNGVVTVGYEYTDAIELSEFSGKKVTIKAACINEFGVLGTIATLTVTVSANPAPEEVEIKLGAVSLSSFTPTLCSGKSVSLTAKVFPSDTLQNVKWSVQDLDGRARYVKIDSSGKLSCRSSDYGTVRVTATSSVLPSLSCSAEFEIKSIRPVATIKLNKTSATLSTPNTLQLTVTTLKDTKKVDVRGSEDHLLSWSTNKSSVATVDQNGLVTAKGAGTAKITCTVLDGSGKKATCSVKVSKSVESITITGIESIAAGKSTTFTATVSPSDATKKTVIWSCVGPATISNKGKLTVQSGATGTVTVYAKASDNSGCMDSRKLNIVSAGTYLKLSVEGPSTRNNGLLSAFNVTTIDPPSSSTALHVRQLTASTNAKVEPVWSSSNTNIATVDSDGNVTGIANGSAVITCTIPDGSGLKATVKVNVITYASSVLVEPNLTRMIFDDFCLAYGYSAKNTVSFGDGYGKPTTGISDIGWTVDITGTRPVPQSVKASVSWNPDTRTLKVDKTASVISYLKYDQLYVSIQAHTTDGSELSSNVVQYEIVPPTTYLTPVDAIWYCEVNESTGYYEIAVRNDIRTDCHYNDFTIVSADPSIVSVFGYNDTFKSYLFICKKVGKTTLTITANDGTGKNCKITVVVRKPE